MPTVSVNGLDLYHEVIGSPGQTPLLLISGLGAHCTGYDDRLCAQLAELPTTLVRFDNRDVGLSTHLPEDTLYQLTDFVADTIGLLDTLGIESTHVVGTSMGGMIAQALTIAHPERVRSLTSIMSTTGEAEVGNPRAELLERLLELSQPAEGRDVAIERGIGLARAIGTPGPDFDEDYHRRRNASFYDRCYDPAGVGRQLVAIVGATERSAGLRGIDVPALVIHGSADPLIDVSGGRRTAELIPNAKYIEIEGMGHDLPPKHWNEIVAAVGELISRAEGSRS